MNTSEHSEMKLPIGRVTNHVRWKNVDYETIRKELELLEEVVGWSIRKNESTGVPGLFGFFKALAFVEEEQGRKTLHVHTTIWIHQYKKLQRDMFFASGANKRHAEKTVQTYYDWFASTALMNDKHESCLAYA